MPRRTNRSLDGLGEDVPDTGCVFAQDVGVDAQGHGGVGVAEAGGYDVDGDSGECHDCGGLPAVGRGDDPRRLADQCGAKRR